MTEKQPEPYVTIKIYKNGGAIIEHDTKTLTTKINSPEFRSAIAMLALSLVFDRTIEGIGRLLDQVFEGEKKDEPRET